LPPRLAILRPACAGIRSASRAHGAIKARRPRSGARRFRPRSNSATPISSSSRRIWRLTAEEATLSASAGLADRGRGARHGRNSAGPRRAMAICLLLAGDAGLGSGPRELMFFSRAPRVNSVRAGNDERGSRHAPASVPARFAAGRCSRPVRPPPASPPRACLPSGGFRPGQDPEPSTSSSAGSPANNQVGEVAAKHLGYFEEEKLNLAIQPGGPQHRWRGHRRLGPPRDRPGVVQPLPDAGGIAEDPGDVLRYRPAAAPPTPISRCPRSRCAPPRT